MLLLDLNSGDGRPIYGQIADRVKFAVAGGVLRAGDLVPSVRELSKQLVVNPNTVARAYRDLQSEGLLESVRGMGLQVAEGAAERCRAERGRSSGSGSARRSKRPGRAAWTRPRSRRSSVKSGRAAAIRATVQVPEAALSPPGGIGTIGAENRRRGRSMTESQAQTGVAIAIEGLTKRFGKQTAVDGLSLSCPTARSSA